MSREADAPRDPYTTTIVFRVERRGTLRGPLAVRAADVIRGRETPEDHSVPSARLNLDRQILHAAACALGNSFRHYLGQAGGNHTHPCWLRLQSARPAGTPARFLGAIRVQFACARLDLKSSANSDQTPPDSALVPLAGEPTAVPRGNPHPGRGWCPVSAVRGVRFRTPLHSSSPIAGLPHNIVARTLPAWIAV